MSELNCVICLTVPVILILLTYMFFRKRKHNLNQKNYEKDVVYLFQFPPSENVPCISPFAMKLETWLKLKKLPYKVIRTSSQWSRKGQIPFVEVNGEQIADSNFVIDHLRSKFNCEDNISPYQEGVSRAIQVMLDNHTTWTYFYYRYVERAQEFLNTWKFVPAFYRKLLAFFFPRDFKKRALKHGIGRHSAEEIYAVGMKDLMAVSDILGDKPFLLGDSINTVDCYLFGHLAQILYIPSVDYPHTDYVRRNCPNLVKFCERIIDKLWPEWETYKIK